MKTLIVTRHAKSSWSTHSNSDPNSDFQRPLNKRGIADTPVMAQRLVARGPIPDLIVSSTAARALATTELLMAELPISQNSLLTTDSIYEAPVDALIKAISSLANHINTAMLVGHNPGVSSLCNYLCVKANIQMPTCAMACLELDIDQWQDNYKDCATLSWYDYPKKDQSEV